MKDFRAVAIVSKRPRCDAARASDTQRRLMATSSCVPLTECSMPDQCQCRFQKHSDRRAEDDRRLFGSTIRSASFSIRERREAAGRRPADR